ncbi:hypothetical protein ABEB36_011693 [Hypothenemus hampei]|uniref:AB hydrolase-1 domain-containing protein n=1 Tax=Hypothenemus hampei TaxID=57062 RepID=A0ABD1ED15_HYPHA
MGLFRNGSKLINYLITARNISGTKPFQEVSIPVPWGVIRGKWWGPTDRRPILTLHGWQDNCGSFDRLIPLLPSHIGFLTIDFPGHGYSSRLPSGQYYDQTVYLLTVKYIEKYFQWTKMSLMGHSLGGITSYSYTMLFCEKIDFVACIDGVKPLVFRKMIPHMAKSLDRFVRNNEFAFDGTEPPSYTLEEMKRKVQAPNNNSVDLERTVYIMQRNIAPSKIHEGQYYFTRDPRLKVNPLFGFSQPELVENAQKVTCPLFISKCKDASYYEDKQNFYETLDVLKRSSADCDFHYINGSHHVHLNSPEELALLLSKFLEKYYVVDTQGGLKEEMIVREKETNSILL